MMRCASAIILSWSPPIEEITANSSPPSRATRSSPRSVCDSRSVTLRIKLVADVMAERVVDVLEVVEVDVEHGRRCAAVADLLDHGLQPLAEEDAVRQPAERVVHGEMAQPRFAGGDRGGGAAHVAQHEGREQREAGERDGDERHDAVDDLGAGLFRRPGKARDHAAVRAGQVVVEVALRHRHLVDLAQVHEPQLRGDAGERGLIDEFHRHDDRRIAVDGLRDPVDGTDGDRRDDRRLAHHAADHRGLGMRAAFGEARLVEADGAVQPRVAPAHVFDHRREIVARAGHPFGVGGAAAEQRVDQLVVAIENEDVVVIEVRFEPVADPVLGPGRVERAPDVLDGGGGGRHAFDFAQHAFAVVRDRAREQLLLMIDRDDVGALGGREHGDDDADDRNGDDDSNGHYDAQASAIPTGVWPRVGCTRTSDSRHDRSPLRRPAHWRFMAGS